MIAIQVERWAEFYPDSKLVFPEHWRELALHQDEIQLSIDEEKYANLDRLGILLILTAREDGRLVGYYLWFLMPHLHYASSGPMGLTDMYFVLPECRRGTGAKLFLASERELRRRGVVKAITSCKVHEDHSEFLRALGWELSDLTFVKLLKGGS
ncbi:GNAT family N-acetyltransferase [Acidicapsa dinghuensis]|uniref:GNAT family N-acetyltransferase n=1 Tax=Acidicapsa dinghuensis TaxID=2218256 RepID=A0ABW1EAU5_9BACT|nr:GNAT family N-acetyltransferase [Acidicapsa dinghuensis]